MKKLLLFALFIMPCTALYAQQTIDTTMLVCKYKYICIKDTIERTGDIETMVLEIGQKSSKFYSEANYLYDSMYNAETAKGLDDQTTLNNIMQSGIHPVMDLNMCVYFNYPANKITVKDKILLTSYCYVEDVEVPKWTLQDSTRNLLGYECKKAVCRFRGRTYFVWYAPEIPTNFGPYKFSGLPGLIMRVTDIGRQIQFACESIQQIKRPIVFNTAEQETKTTKQQFFKVEKHFHSSPDDFFKGHIKVLDNGETSVRRPFSIPYNPIELE